MEMKYNVSFFLQVDKGGAVEKKMSVFPVYLKHNLEILFKIL
jgi:hypothetical protein